MKSWLYTKLKVKFSTFKIETYFYPLTMPSAYPTTLDKTCAHYPYAFVPHCAFFVPRAKQFFSLFKSFFLLCLFQIKIIMNSDEFFNIDTGCLLRLHLYRGVSEFSSFFLFSKLGSQEYSSSRSSR